MVVLHGDAIGNYLENMASLRTNLCVRFKSEVVACGVVYAAARRFQVPLPENPPWWRAFDADKSGIDEVCRVLAHLYRLPKAQYIAVCKEGDSFTSSNKNMDSPAQLVPKEGLLDSLPVGNDTTTPTAGSVPINPESGGPKNSLIKEASGKVKESKKSDGDAKSLPIEGEAREDFAPKLKAEHRTEVSEEKNKVRERDRERERERLKARQIDRGRDSDRERKREKVEMDIDKFKERSRRSKDIGGHSEKSRYHVARGLSNVEGFPGFSNGYRDG
ncbi:Cyclin-l1-1 [Thalictrum thalictroides]|uniref:Cyclin-l1-1 n=1 Tax=Thalictrum thalictroides TaxID=46969 RepID=A0A7J6X7X9_THATH|nr:Cyclin-l1-1 [Thalictrum thalictroides]